MSAAVPSLVSPPWGSLLVVDDEMLGLDIVSSLVSPPSGSSLLVLDHETLWLDVVPSRALTSPTCGSLLPAVDDEVVVPSVVSPPCGSDPLLVVDDMGVS